MTKLRFTTQETREEPFAPSFYRADQHAARPGAWHVTVAGRDYEVTELLAEDAEALTGLLDGLADAVVVATGGTRVDAAPVTPRAGGVR